MSGGKLPVLWLCGPPGVGKSTVAWTAFGELQRWGMTVGYVDVDQLGMCYPRGGDHQMAHDARAPNVAGVLRNFRAAGAQVAIVSGAMDAEAQPLYRAKARASDIAFYRLRLDHQELEGRLAARGAADESTAVLKYADALDRSGFASLTVDTGGKTVDQVLDLVLFHALGSLDFCKRLEPTTIGSMCRAPGSVLWLCGPMAVGKSSVAWVIYNELRRAGVGVGFVDLEQIGFLRPTSADDPANHRLKAANLAAMWDTYSASGAERLIVCGPITAREDLRPYVAALPETSLALCGLRANPGDLRHRITRRAQGGGPRLAGDRLIGQPPEALETALSTALAEDAAVARGEVADLVVETDGRSVEAVAAQVLNVWPAPGG